MLALVDLNQQQIDTIIETVPGGAKNVQDIYPLSPLQEGMLFHHLLNEQSDTYILSTLFELKSHAQVDVLINSLQKVIDRHDILRTAVIWEKMPRPVQVVYRQAALPVEKLVLDLDHDPVEQLKERMKPGRQGMNWRQAPLVRLQVVADVHGAQWYALLQLHHVVCDYQSWNVVVEEAMAFLQGVEHQLPTPTLYRDYVAWALTHARPKDAEVYFRSKLGEIEEPTAPFGILDVHGDGSQIVEACQVLEPALAQRVYIQAQRAGVSQARLFHAAWGLVVANTSGREEGVYGTVLSTARHGSGRTQRRVGMSVNTLPLRLKLQGVTVKELVEQTHQELVELLSYQHSPLTLAQRCSGIAGTAPLFTTLLNYRRNVLDPEVERTSQVGVRVVARGEAWTNYPVTLIVDDQGDGFVLTAQTDRRVDADRVVGYLSTAVQSLVEALERAPHTPALALSILPESERYQLINSFNATQVTYPRDKLIHELFEEQVERTPHEIAVVCADEHLTYKALNFKGNQLARYLRKHGVGPDCFVGLCVERGVEMVVGMLGILKAGGAYVPVDPNYPQQRLEYMLGDTAPTVVLTQDRVKDQVPLAWPVIALDTQWSEIAQEAATNLKRESLGVSSSNLAYVIYTSGSTGQPKGVAIEHRNAVNLIWWARSAMCWEVFEQTLQSTSLSFDLSVYECFVPLATGGTLRVVQNALAVLNNPLGVTLVNMVPSAIKGILDLGSIPETARVVNLAGEPLKRELVCRIFACSSVERVCNLYGPSETTTYSSWVSMSRQDGFMPTIGRPIANTQIYILDRCGRIVPIGVVGEIYIAGAGVARGYLNRPELTGERFLPDPFNGDPQPRMYKTGDLGRWRTDGAIEYLGRNDDQVKIRGFRIELGEIEARLACHEQVKEAVVIAQEDASSGKRLVAYVVPSKPIVTSPAPTVEELRAHLRVVLPEYMVPSAFVVLECLPLTTNGKLDRRALPQPEIESYVSQQYEAPQGEVEEVLAGIWQQLLQLERIGRDDSFFELGGDSLLAMQLLSRVQSALSIEMPIRSLFERPTVKQLSARVDDLRRAGLLDRSADSGAEVHELLEGSELMPGTSVQESENRSRQTREIKPRPRADSAGGVRLPTSWAQQRLWFIDQLEGGGAAYNIPLVLRLRGTLDRQALQSALDTLVQRHEVLRTVFASVEGDPRQEITPEGRFALQVTDLSSCGAVVREAQVQLQKVEEARARFDLRVGPLIRGRLLRVQAEDHVLLITMHHIVSDGWSMGVLIRELTELYSAYQERRNDPMPALPIQYADYAQWQRQWLQGQVLDAQLSYWSEHLAGAAPELTLPTDRPRPAVQSYRGRNLEVLLDTQLSADLNVFARRHGMTLFMVLYAGWAILLSRLSGQEDVLIGAPVANRRRPELEGLIGFFVNTLVLRVQVTFDLLLRKFLEKVKDVTLEAYDHQDMPFEQVVEALRPERSLSRHPIFQVMFALQNAPQSELRLSGLKVTVEEGVNETSKFDLLLSLEERGGEIGGYVNYDSDLLDHETVERWSANFTVLLRGMIGGEQCRIGNLPILAETEHRRVVELFNATQELYPQESFIHELFEAQVQRTPNEAAAVHEGQSLTYAELNARANQLARYLRSKGIGPGQLVGICVERSLDMVIGLLGILKAGGAYVPVDPNHPIERLQYMLEDAAPQALLTQESLKAVLPATAGEVIALDEAWKEITSNVDEDLTATELGPTAPDLVYVIYTSGSTGRPKGTAMPHRSMVNLIEWHRQNLRISVGQRVLQYAALGFDVAFQEIFSTLCSGGTLVLLDEWVRRDAGALMELLSDQSIERLFVPPLMLQSLAEWFSNTGRGPRSLKDVITAGEQLRVSPEIVNFFKYLDGCQLHNHYGPTETHVVTALTLVGNPEEWSILPTIGRPISNAQIYVLDGQRQPVPIGVAGEIYIGGANLARRYLNQPELTTERFLRDPFSTDQQSRLYRTGDLGRWRADGTIEYLGRNDDQVKIRGYRIELGEIEAQLATHSKVRDVAVIAREDVPGDKRLVAYVTRRDQNDPSIDGLRAHLKGVLPEYMVPSAFVILESLPLTPSGKLDRRALPEPQSGQYTSLQYEAPQGEVEEDLARIWQELLQVEQVGRQDNFFELGGHSLLVLKALSKTNQSLGSALSVIDVYRSPTIQELATRIGAGTVKDSDLVDLSGEAALDHDILAKSGPRCVPAKAVMLTGGTGFVGRFLLAQLLQDTDATIYCVVRAPSQYQASSRVRATLEKWDLWRAEFERRIVAIPGDLRLPRLGIDELTYRSLAQNIDSIYHCATSMNHLETYAMARPANVESARELLKLATNHKPKLINYISTLGVFRSSAIGSTRVVDEASLIDDEKHSTANGYVTSKWVGEKIFMTAGDRGIPCNIFRVGFVWADMQQGRYDELQHGYRVIKSSLLSGVGIKNYRHHSPPTPVDYVARAVVSLANRHSDGKGVFHISSPAALIDGVFERCNEVAGTSLELLSFYEWVCEMKRLYQEGRSMPVVPLIESAFSMDEKTFYDHQHRNLSANVPFDCTRTYRELEHAGIVAPAFDDDLLRLCVGSMLSRDAELRELIGGTNDLKFTTNGERIGSTGLRESSGAPRM